MAHFAKVEEGIVTQVIVADSQQWCEANLGGTWVQTSYNGNFRKHYAGIGFSYDETLDAFIPPKPTEGNWVLNTDLCIWEPEA